MRTIQTKARDYLRKRSPSGHTQGERDAYFGAWLDCMNWQEKVNKLPEEERIAALDAAYDEAENYALCFEHGPSKPRWSILDPLIWLVEQLERIFT